MWPQKLQRLQRAFRRDDRGARDIAWIAETPCRPIAKQCSLKPRAGPTGGPTHGQTYCMLLARPRACDWACRANASFSGQGGSTDEAEDQFVFTRLFSKGGEEPLLRGGTFIELGAHDGIVFSNSLFFERHLGWRGLLIEPSPESFAALKRVRGTEGNTLVHAAVGCTSASGVAFAASGLKGSMRPARDHHFKPMPCRRLDELLREASISRVDLFSLDTEGSELQVLRTFNWSVPIGALVVEQDASHASKDEQVRTLLRQHGMQLAGRIGFGRRNELWLGRSLAGRLDAARRPWTPRPGSWGCAASPAGHCCHRHRVKRATEACLRQHAAFGISY